MLRIQRGNLEVVSIFLIIIKNTKKEEVYSKLTYELPALAHELQTTIKHIDTVRYIKYTN